MKKSIMLVLSLFIMASIILASCAPQVQEVIKTVVVTQEVIKEGQTVIETQIVEVMVTPEPAGPAEIAAADPETWNYVTFGDAETLDPAWNYESFGDGILEDVYDTLVGYPGAAADTVVPKLATSWEVLDGGTTYVFTIREGVKFHEGQDLDPEDVAYSFQRGVLQGGGFSPQWLYTEALFGAGVYDIAELVNPDVADDPVALQAEDPAKLLEACETVTSAISADPAAGTVTFKLAQSWGPLLVTMAGSWGSIIDKDWAIANGAWDGDCATWQNYYGITSETAPLRAVTNGTGPYKLDHWTPGEEFVLVANEDYWQTEPLYEGGPAGPARLKRVLVKEVDEWGTRFAMLQAGDADYATVPAENEAQVDPLVGEICTFVDWGQYDCVPSDNPNGPLRRYDGTPTVSRTDAFFVFDINTEGGNPYIGSGQLDGNGVPANFFSDVHVRRAFNYCFDWDAYISEVFGGNGVQNYGPINVGMLGYNPDGAHYSFDPDMCASELQQAWGGEVWEKGFRVQVAFNTGNTTRQAIAQILQANFADIDPKFNVEIIGLPWPSFLSGIRASRFPLYVTGWGEDIHDPHNWAQPMLVGTYAARQKLPEDILNAFNEKIISGVTAPTDEEREALYFELGQMDYDEAIAIRLAVRLSPLYVQRWVTDYLINPMLRQPFYNYAKQ